MNFSLSKIAQSELDSVDYSTFISYPWVSNSHFWDEADELQDSFSLRKSNYSIKDQIEALTDGLRVFLVKEVRDAKDRFLRQFESYFLALENKAENYVLSADLINLVKTKYSDYEPRNICSMVRYQFSHLVPQVIQSCSKFSQNLRTNVSLETNINETPRQHQTFQNLFELKQSSAQCQGYFSNCKHNSGTENQNSFKDISFCSKQIQTSQFESFKTPQRPFLNILQQNQERQALKQCLSQDYHQNIVIRNDLNIIDDFQLKWNFDQDTKQKMQRVLKKHKDFWKGQLRQNVPVISPMKLHSVNYPQKVSLLLKKRSFI